MAQIAKHHELETVLPVGTITLLLTDIAGSTQLWEQDADAMAEAVRRHHEIFHQAIDQFHGHRPADQGEGDSIFAAFTTATDAVSAILQAQSAIAAQNWPTSNPLSVRAAIHTGEVELRDGRNYFGPSVNKTARLRSVAHGGQVLVSQVTRDLTRGHLPSGADYIDLGLHRLKDLSLPEHVYQLTHPALQSEFPSIKSLDSVANNLPVQLTTLIGRTEEVSQVQELMVKGRLTTLTGAAGCGKTRLSLHVAAEDLDKFPDGVWFVDLAPINDPALVAQAAADSLGLQRVVTELDSTTQVSSQERSDPTARLTDFIGDKTTLMILDNCEHVIEAAAQLVDRILRSCPNLRIMPTSREPLGVPGEATYRVPSLPTPDPEHLPPLEQAGSFDAVQLFVERAALVRGDFSLTPENAKAVAQICRRLDGIPLAIELAAARVSALSPQQISQRLDDQFRLLTGGSRTSLERQQTLRAAVDWSYRLLTDQERALLRRLSIFHGGFTIEAAEKVASGDGLEEPDVVDLLSQLVTKSLVQRETGEGDGRYRLLETIRQFSREKMLETGEVQETGRRHRDFFLEFAERAGPELYGPNVGLWIEYLEAEVDNLRAAMTWSAAEVDQKPLFRFCSALDEFWDLRGYVGEGLQLVEQALSREAEPSKERIRALASGVRLAVFGGSIDKSRAFALELMEQAEALDDDWGKGRAHLSMGFQTMLAGKFDQAEQHLLDVETLATASGDSYGFTLAAVFRSELAQIRGQSAEEGAALEIALQRARRAGQKLLVGRVLGGMSAKAIRRGDWEKFREIAEEGLATSVESGDKIMAAIYSASLSEAVGPSDPQWAAAVTAVRDFRDPEWFQTLGAIALGRNEHEEAKALWDEALDICRAENRGELPRMLNQAGWAIYLTGDLSEARKYLEECIPLARTSSVKILLFYALHSYGEILRVSGELETARKIFEESETGVRELGQKEGVVHVLLSLGDIDRAERMLDEAAARYFESGLIRVAMDSLNELPPVLERLAGVALDKGLIEQGLKMLGASRKIREVRRSSIEPVYMEARLRDLQGLTEAAGESTESLLAEGELLDPREALDLARVLLPPDRLEQILENVEKSSEEA